MIVSFHFISSILVAYAETIGIFAKMVVIFAKMVVIFAKKVIYFCNNAHAVLCTKNIDNHTDVVLSIIILCDYGNVSTTIYDDEIASKIVMIRIALNYNHTITI